MVAKWHRAGKRDGISLTDLRWRMPNCWLTQHQGTHELSTRSGVAAEWVGSAPSALLPRAQGGATAGRRLGQRTI